MSEFDVHEYPPDEAVEGEPEEVSPDTGTVYGEEGEAEATPHDLEPVEDEE
jgi:hypothetical protein